MNAYLRKNVFILVVGSCALFVLLTLFAMLLYQGGNSMDHSTPGYIFTQNFFSDLGRTVAHSGRANVASAVMFFIALFMAGAGLILFFLAFPRFFTQSWHLRWLSLAGSILGVLAGACFIGVAFTPANLLINCHIFFVTWGFRLFPMAVFFYVFALFLNSRYPHRYAWLFVVFCLLLTGYYLLLTEGPGMGTSQGFFIQVVGQKIIAYASILSIGLQALGAHIYRT